MDVTVDLDDVKNISRCGFYLAQGYRCANKPVDNEKYWVILAFKGHANTFYPLLAMEIGEYSAIVSCYAGILSDTNLYWLKLSNN